MTFLRLPVKTENLIKQYFSIRFGLHKIRCPYFQNVTRRPITLVFAGKGLPQEIEVETLKLYSQRKQLLNKLSPNKLRFYMVLGRLGIDCSGLVVNILNSLLQEKNLGTLWKKLKYPSVNPFSQLTYNFRPRSNISAAMLTHPINTFSIKNVNQIKPGDLLKVGNSHVAIVTEVEMDKKKNVKRVSYVHSTSDYFEQHGIRRGNIFIINKDRPLEKQKWDEEYRGKNWMLEDYLAAPKNQKGFKRLKTLS